jgi:hypothetical protein
MSKEPVRAHKQSVNGIRRSLCKSEVQSYLLSGRSPRLMFSTDFARKMRVLQSHLFDFATVRASFKTFHKIGSDLS